MEVQGKVKLVGKTESVGTSGFQKRDIIVTTDEQYPQYISVQFVQDKCDLLNPIEVGQDVKIGINLRGREWVSPQGETRYFNTIQGWRIEKTAASPGGVEAPVMQSQGVVPPEDDLPF